MKANNLLYPFSMIYGTILAIRRFLYHHKWISSAVSPITTFCIGNISLGGTGKTPHTEYLVRILKERSIAILSRGYRRKSRGCIIAEQYSPEIAFTIGDEPALYLKKYPNIPIAVSEKRRKGIHQLLSKFPSLDAIILDDAFQHLDVDYTCKILLTEYDKPYFNDIPIPAGTLREFPSAAQYADIFIVTKCPETLSPVEKSIFVDKIAPKAYQRVFCTTIQYKKIIPANELAKGITLSKNTPILLVTGIANPLPLQKHLQKSFSNITVMKFPDHHYFSKIDINKIENFFIENEQEHPVIITTEKDFTRFECCKEKILSLHPIYVAPIEISFLFDEENKFKSIINSYVRKN